MLARETLSLAQELQCVVHCVSRSHRNSVSPSCRKNPFELLPIKTEPNVDACAMAHIFCFVVPVLLFIFSLPYDHLGHIGFNERLT